ncbi:MAG: hypothetical protein P4M15_07290 [Alphaproteobacteria bacterium]|nr:hypothetical protein [Alphaproteobacteria bacterium]
MTTKRRTAAELIGIHLCSDIRDIQECRYQPTRFASPAVYSIGEYYFCSPTGMKTKLPVDREVPNRWQWEEVGMYYNRPIFRAHMSGERK